MKLTGGEADLINDQSLGTVIVQRIQAAILDGEFERGQRLLETELAERFGVSRGPVRDALRVLHLEGWVDTRLRGGSFVRNPTPREVDEFFHIKGILEAEAARLFALSASDEDVELLRGILVRGMQAIEHSDNRTLVALSTRMHLIISELSGNSILSEILRPIQQRLPFFFAFSSANAVNVEAWAEHAELVKAFEARDGDLAARIMIEHSVTAKVGYRHLMAPSQ